MKDICLLVFLLCSIYSFGQSDFRINLLSNLNFTLEKYNHDGEVSWFRDSFEYKTPLGYAGQLELEFQIDPSFSLISGLRYSHNILYPRVQLFYFVVTIQTSEGISIMGPAYLSKHEFKILSIPIIFKKHFRIEKKISWYVLGGATVGYRFKEIETYEGMFSNQIEGANFRNKIEAKNANFSFFNTALEIGAGTSIILTSDFNLIIQTSAQVFEFRKANDKAVKNDGALVWRNESILPIGQVSLGIGLQREF